MEKEYSDGIMEIIMMENGIEIKDMDKVLHLINSRKVF